MKIRVTVEHDTEIPGSPFNGDSFVGIVERLKKEADDPEVEGIKLVRVECKAGGHIWRRS